MSKAERLIRLANTQTEDQVSSWAANRAYQLIQETNKIIEDCKKLIKIEV